MLPKRLLNEWLGWGDISVVCIYSRFFDVLFDV